MPSSIPRSCNLPPLYLVRRPAKPRNWYKGYVSEHLNQLLADEATTLVRENFTNVRARWWWERRLGGGIVVCQELDPKVMTRELSRKTERKPQEVEHVIKEDLGLEDPEPVVLTFEIPGDVTAAEAAWMLAERSAVPEGLAANLYRRVERTVRES